MYLGSVMRYMYMYMYVVWGGWLGGLMWLTVFAIHIKGFNLLFIMHISICYEMVLHVGVDDFKMLIGRSGISVSGDRQMLIKLIIKLINVED